MNATDILSGEHRVIGQVLDSLEKLIEQGHVSGSFAWDSAKQVIDFLQHFADQCHHGKEEKHLFPLLEARGFSQQFGPTVVMRGEHVEGRNHVKAMAEAVEAGLRGETPDVPSFAEHARRYVNLLREHISKEDHCLFPMANRALTEQDQDALLHAFESVEQGLDSHREHEKYLELADALADRFGVPHARTAAIDAKQFAGCCGHA